MEAIDTSPYVPANADEWRLHLSKYLDNRAAYPHGLSKMACEIASAISDKTFASDVSAIHNFVAEGVYEHLKTAAPGIAEPSRRAIANSLAIKLSRKLAAM